MREGVIPGVWRSLPQVGMVFFTISFVLIFDVGAALLIELFVLPRKKVGVYRGHSRSVLDYIGRMIPRSAAEWAPYRGACAAYWLTIASLFSFCVAMVAGFVGLWVRAFGPSIFGAWYAGLGLDKGGILDATLDPSDKASWHQLSSHFALGSSEQSFHQARM